MAISKNNGSSSDVYIICSDDPMLKLERTSNLISQARSTLPNAEFLLYTFSELQGAGAGGPNLKEIEGQMSDPGLFGGDRIIKVILKDFDELAIELFKLIATCYRPGLFIIVEMPRITATYAKVEAKSNADLKGFASFLPGSDGAAALLEQESKKNKKSSGKSVKKTKRASGIETRRKESFAYLKGIGAHIEFIYTPEGENLRRWILDHARLYGLVLTPEALEFIISACDNNLLVINQSLQMMQLVHSGTSLNAPLTLEDAETYFTQDARYTGFEISEAILLANHNKALNIINSFCSGQNQGLSQALGFLISRLDESLNIVYKGKALNIAAAQFNERNIFFAQHKVKVRSAQEAHLKAIRDMPAHMLEYLTKNLAQASRAYSHFDNDQALLALQRMACIKCQGSYNLTNISEDYC